MDARSAGAAKVDPEPLPTPDPTVPPPGLSRFPKTIDLSITGRCNLKCRYCFYADEMTALGDMPAERWHALFKELGELGVQHLVLSGGEVFTRPDLFELIDGIIANRMRYSILSNGTLITEDTLKAFERGKRRLRLDSIQVSIDGSCAEIHDKSRPPKSFDRALRGLRLLKQANFPVTVRVTVNRANVDDLPNVARLLLDDVGLGGFSTNEADQMGSARCFGDSTVLTRSERKRAMESLSQLNRQYGGRISATAGPLAAAANFAEIEEAYAKGKTGTPGRGTLCSCGGVFQKLAILHDGTIVPCNMLPKLVMGVFGHQSLAEVWRNSPAINVVRYRRQIPMLSLPTCKDCSYAGFCTGGCPGSVMAKFGRLNARDPLVCYRIFKGEEDDSVVV
jgi:SynChlorMet cassette radical SAM/SPASM protein ScmE